MPIKYAKNKTLTELFGFGAFAGLAGGAAEVIWISIAHQFGGTSPVGVARAITAAFGQSPAAPASLVMLGVSIHFALAAVLGGVMYVAWKRLLEPPRIRFNILVFSIATLTVIWVINFYLVLPSFAPGFISKVPVWTGFISKISFAVAFGWSIRAIETRKRASTRSAIEA